MRTKTQIWRCQNKPCADVQYPVEVIDEGKHLQVFSVKEARQLAAQLRRTATQVERLLKRKPRAAPPATTLPEEG